MKIAVVAPRAAQGTWGGAERAVRGLAHAIDGEDDHRSDVVELVVDESDLVGLVHGYHEASLLDLDSYDRVVSVKYPVWLLSHPRHVVYMFHPLRGLYDTYHVFGEPEHAEPATGEAAGMLAFIRRHNGRAALPEFFEEFHLMASSIGRDHPDLRLPGPFSRAVVHWLDRIALAPGSVCDWFALSHTVASRDGYFPPGVVPKVAPLPSDLPVVAQTAAPRSGLFTASRLDGAKRIDLLIDAMAHVRSGTTLTIAGSGPLESDLRRRAERDGRIDFVGHLSDEDLAARYASAVAVPFVPADEDQGLIVQEAFAQATPVVCCTDSGGPTEFVVDGMTGLVAPPDPLSLGRALDRLVADPGWAAILGATARERAARVTWPRLVRRLVGDTGHGGRTAQPPITATEPTGEARPTVMVLATFTIDAPRHGGELRARNLYGALSESADVHLVGLTDPNRPATTAEIAPGLRQTTVPRSPAHQQVCDEIGAIAGIPVTDVLAGVAADATPELLRTVRSAGRDVDAVVLAEPYLLPVLHAAELRVPFLYDAYNVEASLKRDAFPPSKVRDELLGTVEEVERAAVTESDVVVACSEADAVDLARRYDRNVAAFEVIPNGTSVRPSIATAAQRASATRRWLDRFAGTAGPSRSATFEHLAVFFGSWHPPNLDAAGLLIEASAALPDVLFLSCGSHGSAFAATVVPPNMVFTGNVSESSKARLLGAASVALNPMRTGSGTNLKLVEYLSAGVPVVSTPFGARGVGVRDGEHLLLAAPERFAHAVGEVLADPAAAHRRAVAGHALVSDAFGWPHLGSDLAGLVHDIIGPPTSN